MGKGDGSGLGLGMGHAEGSGAGRGQGWGLGSGAYKGKTERIAVPAMPMPMAVICCVLNFIFPGLGTMIAGLSNFCCSRNEDIDGAVRIVSCCTNFGIGILQLLTVALCLIGWAWSCLWGVYFIFMSSDYYHNNTVNDRDRSEGVVIAQHNQPGVVIVQQNQPGVVIAQNNQPVVISQAGAPVNVVTVIRQPVGTTFGQPMLQPPAYGQPVIHTITQ